MKLTRKLGTLIRSKFLFVIRREQDFSVITSFNISALRIVAIIALILILVFGVSLVISKTLLKVWFDPAYKDSENTAMLIQMSETVDSLIFEVEKKDSYVKNIQRIMAGEFDGSEDVEGQDSVLLSERRSPETNLFVPSEATLSIIQEMRGVPLDMNTSDQNVEGYLGDNYFFPPIKGVVTSLFDPIKEHFGIDIVAKENEAVKSIADGTVIFSAWTLGTGYVIGIQHVNELISIYKHNSVILKNVGDVIKGGEIVSIIGNTGELTTGPHLHFEIWYKGSPLNPQDFISFD
ncbi:M23 family metallopeptidase [Shivajiella indica]|uniref:M23 family metallopeptidase n=1 Tax=Shivajiella indica TaxID=872115 RepID=A0ABW5B1T1_9BACT